MSWNALPQWLTGQRASDTKTVSKLLPSGSNDDAHDTNTVVSDYADDEDGESTPKAKAATPVDNVPTFMLTERDEPTKSVNDAPTAKTPTFPAANSAQRASLMPPPPRMNGGSAPKEASSLMAPPPRVPQVRRTPPSAAASLQIPSTGPLPNRGPPSNSQQRVSSSLAPTSAVATRNSRGKVLLAPGHSPMDWAALIKQGDLTGVSTFQRVTPSELRKKTGRRGNPAWSSWQGRVYNITPYLSFHPGGEGQLMRAAGRDGGKLFMEVHPWVNWENMLGSCLVGVMVPEDHGEGRGESSLEDMD